jgi:hypothetical protein
MQITNLTVRRLTPKELKMVGRRKEMDFTNKEITVSPKIIFVDGVPECFAHPIDSLEHMDSWIHTPLDINPEADAFANDDGEDHSNDAIINYDCIAWQ